MAEIQPTGWQVHTMSYQGFLLGSIQDCRIGGFGERASRERRFFPKTFLGTMEIRASPSCLEVSKMSFLFQFLGYVRFLEVNFPPSHFWIFSLFSEMFILGNTENLRRLDMCFLVHPRCKHIWTQLLQAALSIQSVWSEANRCRGEELQNMTNLAGIGCCWYQQTFRCFIWSYQHPLDII